MLFFQEGTYMNFCMMNLKHEKFYTVELIPRDITPKGYTFVNFIIIKKCLRAGPTLHDGPYTIHYRDETGTTTYQPWMGSTFSFF